MSQIDSRSSVCSETLTRRGATRRQFLRDTTLASGSLALGLALPGFALAQGAAAAASPELNVWVLVHPDDRCVVRFARTEMGQGTLTGIAQLVAEELECDWAKVSIDYVSALRNFESKRAWGEMGTGGSRGIRTSHDYVRRGGAAARLMLVQAAAARWQVPVAELSTLAGVVSHKPTGRSLRYGELVADAAKLTAPDPKTITLKNPKNWTLAGKPLARLDSTAKTNGSKVFGIDVKLPGMLNAAVRDCPVFGGKLVSFNFDAIKTMPGVKAAVRVDDSTVAVVADTWWRAKKALEALPIVWDEGANAKVNSASIKAFLQTGLDAPTAFAERNEGDAKGAIAKAAKRVEATYSTPFLSHATMETMNCTALYTDNKAEVWVPTQNAEGSHAALSEASGLPLAKCEVYRIDPGGAFGRRGGPQDYVRQATAIAKQFKGTPIKMIWSREEDQMHGFYRPISMCKMTAGLDEKGELVGLHVRLSGQSINARVAPQLAIDGKDKRQLQGWWKEAGDAQLGYTIPNLLTEYSMRNTHVPVGTWRGVNTNQNGVYMECFIDEVARAAGADQLEFRRKLARNHPKHLAVLNAAAERAKWGTPLPKGVFRGIAQFMGYASYSAAVAEVSVDAQGNVKVHRMVFALDCGHVVNPQQVAAQVEGSVALGLGATLHSAMTVENGRMRETNFDTYPSLKLREMPPVDVVIVPTYDFWGGVGEPTICVVAPAFLNAVRAATGKHVRDLPLKAAALV